jgi:hypothetical protein
VVFPSKARASSMVTNVMQGRRSDESSLPQLAHWRLDVERVTPSKTNKTAIARKPFIWSLDVAVIRIFSKIRVGLSILDFIKRRGFPILINVRHRDCRWVRPVDCVSS